MYGLSVDGRMYPPTVLYVLSGWYKMRVIARSRVVKRAGRRSNLPRILAKRRYAWGQVLKPDDILENNLSLDSGGDTGKIASSCQPQNLPPFLAMTRILYHPLSTYGRLNPFPAHQRIPAYARPGYPKRSRLVLCHTPCSIPSGNRGRLLAYPPATLGGEASIGSSVDALCCPVSIPQTRCSVAGSTKAIVVGRLSLAFTPSPRSHG